MKFRLLGSLEARDAGSLLDLGGAKQRALLAILLLQPNRVVSSARLIEELWGGDAPATARAALRVHVAGLRKALEPGRVQTRSPGYLIAVQAGELDVDCFHLLVESADRSFDDGRWDVAARSLREALALWRGPALVDFADEEFAQAPTMELEEQRLAALERRIEVELALGRHAKLVGELQTLVAAQPFREVFRRQLMLALYRCGRQADALTAYRQARRKLVDELGIEPSLELQGTFL